MDWQFLPEKHDVSFIVTDKLPKKVEYYSLDTEKSELGGIGEWSIAYRENGQLYVVSMKGVQDKKILESLSGTCVMHNAKYDLNELIKADVSLPKATVCTMISSYCMGLGRQDVKDSAKDRDGSNMVGGLGLKYLARRHLGMSMRTWDEIKDHPEWKEEYNANDSVATLLLWEKWRDKLPQHFWDIDMPLLPVLMRMEDRGILVDPNFLQKYAQELDTQLAGFDLPLNPFAPQEIQSYVYGVLAIEPWRFTPSGAPSTDAEALEDIEDPVVKKILEYKEVYQDRNTYASGYMKAMDDEGRIHSEFKQTSTATGRLSSANPNLQNVVKKGDRVELRKLFVVPRGKKMIRMDWKLVEFGMLAVLAKDDALIDAFLHSDVHALTAKALGVDRDTGKHINFLIQNGGTAWGISKTYGIPLDEAKTHYNKYMEKFPAIKRFQEETVAKAKETKYAQGPFGRRRRLDALFAQDWRVRQEGENEAKTMPMQNGAAELVKLAMIHLDHDHNAPQILQVHDEILFEVPEEEARDYATWLKSYVPTITEIQGIQFPVELSIGNSWWECLQKENVI